MSIEKKMILVQVSCDVDFLKDNHTFAQLAEKMNDLAAQYPAGARLIDGGEWGNDDWEVSYTRQETDKEAEVRIAQDAIKALTLEKKVARLSKQLAEAKKEQEAL